ncbi:hypothetical protein B0H15DRAFT_848566 [Mycena belliarum]|uniref:Uncharacterized protein n=1 Tax=Mycena belliarum TaxID=1033014 RepID=A0AAD6U0Y8_9AGAR|nr:hypothetical protein B0H15DRAFT_848566 [Mycena belliae]
MTDSFQLIVRFITFVFIFYPTAIGTKTLFPYVWGTTLHAARISLVFHTNMRATNSRLSWGAHILGFLLMCWGGSFASHLLLSLPPPQLYAFGPWINYSAVHLLVTVLFHYLPIPDPSLANTVLFPFDGLLRANAVIQIVSLLTLPSVNPVLVASPLFHFILGAAASASGGLLGGTLSLWTPNWQFSTPPPLRTGVWGLWSTLDIWAGGAVASLYGVLTAHPAFLPLRASVTSQALPMSALDARVVSAMFMITMFGLRVFVPAIAPSPKPVPEKRSATKVKTN